ncbi:MAG: XRE family transcriptional regulator [Leptolyngbya sp. LCM1.Bin17]|nr:MAG: XRE family transcriptional regulator [Leptolyngbya sp. LCM1.Bin17]
MERAPRSLKVHPTQIAQVKAAYGRSGCFNQKDLAEELGLSLDTLSKFLNGKPVDRMNALQICDRLSLDPDPLLMLGTAEVDAPEATPISAPELLTDGELAPLPPVMDVDFEEAVAVDPGSTAASAATIHIKQDLDTVEGLAAGHANQVNEPGAAPTQPSAPPSQVDVEQTVKVVKPSGIVIGSANQINRGPQEEA